MHDRSKGVEDPTTACPALETVIGSTWDGAVVGEMTVSIAFDRSLCVRRVLTFDHNNGNLNGNGNGDVTERNHQYIWFRFYELCVTSDLGSVDEDVFCVLVGTGSGGREEERVSKTFLTIVVDW